MNTLGLIPVSFCKLQQENDNECKIKINPYDQLIRRLQQLSYHRNSWTMWQPSVTFLLVPVLAATADKLVSNVHIICKRARPSESGRCPTEVHAISGSDVQLEGMRPRDCTLHRQMHFTLLTLYMVLNLVIV